MVSPAPTTGKSGVMNQLRQTFAQAGSLRPAAGNSTPLAAETTDQTPTTSNLVTEDQALDLLDQVLTETEVAQNARDEVSSQQSTNSSSADASLQSVAPVIPQVVAQAADTLNPAGLPVVSQKERVAQSAQEALVIDTTTAQSTEVEGPKELELPVEVQDYVERVSHQDDQLPQEIVVADDSASVSKQYPKQPVIVLPITPAVEQQGRKKSTAFSIRWLVEWSQKIMKIFAGKVIYRQPEEAHS